MEHTSCFEGIISVALEGRAILPSSDSIVHASCGRLYQTEFITLTPIRVPGEETRLPLQPILRYKLCLIECRVLISTAVRLLFCHHIRSAQSSSFKQQQK